MDFYRIMVSIGFLKRNINKYKNKITMQPSGLDRAVFISSFQNRRLLLRKFIKYFTKKSFTSTKQPPSTFHQLSFQWCYIFIYIDIHTKSSASYLFPWRLQEIWGVGYYNITGENEFLSQKTLFFHIFRCSSFRDLSAVQHHILELLATLLKYITQCLTVQIHFFVSVNI